MAAHPIPLPDFVHSAAPLAQSSPKHRHAPTQSLSHRPPDGRPGSALSPVPLHHLRVQTSPPLPDGMGGSAPLRRGLNRLGSICTIYTSKRWDPILRSELAWSSLWCWQIKVLTRDIARYREIMGRYLALSPQAPLPLTPHVAAACLAVPLCLSLRPSLSAPSLPPRRALLTLPVSALYDKSSRTPSKQPAPDMSISGEVDVSMRCKYGYRA